MKEAAETPATTLPNVPHEVHVDISKSRPSFPCKCGRALGPNEGRTVFRANVKKLGASSSLTGQPAYSGRNVHVFTCPDCKTGYVVESPQLLTVAEPPTGEARNRPCPCGSGRKAKKCHPAGFVPIVDEKDPAFWREP